VSAGSRRRDAQKLLFAISLQVSPASITNVSPSSLSRNSLLSAARGDADEVLPGPMTRAYRRRPPPPTSIDHGDDQRGAGTR
jgi:hypothetical protein